MRRPPRGRVAVAALAAILIVTVAWWTFALWPVPAGAPAWVVRTRALCFGVHPGGGPDLAGWMLLLGEPLAMLGILLTVWGAELREATRRIVSRWERSLALTAAPLIVLALAVLAERAGGSGGELFAVAEAPGTVSDFPRVDRPAPPLALIDQRGDTVRLDQFLGRPVLVTFAYGHCQTVCPLVVHDLVAARARLGRASPALLIVTLDPWRDTPARLPAIAAEWGLPVGAHLLGGSVADVEATLDAWGVPRLRDPASGELTHSSVVTLLDRRGRIAYTVTGGADAIVEYARRL